MQFKDSGVKPNVFRVASVSPSLDKASAGFDLESIHSIQICELHSAIAKWVKEAILAKSHMRDVPRMIDDAPDWLSMNQRMHES